MIRAEVLTWDEFERYCLLAHGEGFVASTMQEGVHGRDLAGEQLRQAF